MIRECKWIPPAPSIIKANTDVQLLLKIAGMGIVFRDSTCNFRLVAWQNLRDVGSYDANISALGIAVLRAFQSSKPALENET
ncbi:hypothetical protein FRX31_027038 [Thalictrum thalictroides]|uniref:Uncharacterized protein n=1 Tax=Thalictrum thalictroides TaxID=46969 RepID=A0A7J6VGP2_THATH|nr:hypothetical protein FRX31_027038 [Thalictrum thalictroides]